MFNTLIPFNFQGLYGYFNLHGEIAIEPQYEFASIFSNGSAVVKKNSKFGYIDNKGKLKINYLFEEAVPFDNGVAIVYCNGGYGLIDHNGNFLIFPQYEDVYGYNSSGFVIVKDNSKTYKILDMKNKFSELFSCQCEDMSGIDECEWIRVFKNSRYYFINPTGKITLMPAYHEVGWFHEHMASVKIDDNFGFINRHGALVIKPLFDEVGACSESVFSAMKNDKWGFVDCHTVKWVIFPKYEVVTPFNQGLASVCLNGRWGCVNKYGDEIIPCIFDEHPAFYYNGLVVNVYSHDLNCNRWYLRGQWNKPLFQKLGVGGEGGVAHSIAEVNR